MEVVFWNHCIRSLINVIQDKHELIVVRNPAMFIALTLLKYISQNKLLDIYNYTTEHFCFTAFIISCTDILHVYKSLKCTPSTHVAKISTHFFHLRCLGRNIDSHSFVFKKCLYYFGKQWTNSKWYWERNAYWRELLNASTVNSKKQK